MKIYNKIDNFNKMNIKFKNFILIYKVDTRFGLFGHSTVELQSF